MGALTAIKFAGLISCARTFISTLMKMDIRSSKTHEVLDRIKVTGLGFAQVTF